MLFTRLVKIHQPIFLRSAQSIIEKLNYKRWILCSWQRGQKNPFRHFTLRNATSPEGGGLGKTGRSRPHSLMAGRSQLLICKLSAPAKVSPFRERWHSRAVTERVELKHPSPAECPSCSVKPGSCKKQERSTSRPHQNHNGRSASGVSPCQRETILLKRKKNALFYKMEKATYHSFQNEQKNLVHVHKKTTLV